MNSASFALVEMEGKASEAPVPIPEDYVLNKFDIPVADANAPECETLHPDQNSLKEIVANLCKGIPSMVSLRMHDIETSGDNGKTWKARPFYPNRHSSHAMVATGIEWEGATPYIVFRHSWEAGDEKTPHKSKARLPFHAHCRIYRAATFTGPADSGEGKARPKSSVLSEKTTPPLRKGAHELGVNR